MNRRSTQDPAILVGPIYLHWHGAFTTYHRFFTHLQSRLLSGVDCTEVGYSNLIVGSDEEKALTKALQQCFQGSTLLLCTRHLQENMARYLRSKCGVPESRLLSVTFLDVMGLLSANSVYDFGDRSLQLSGSYHYLNRIWTLFWQETCSSTTWQRTSATIKKYQHPTTLD